LSLHERFSQSFAVVILAGAVSLGMVAALIAIIAFGERF